MKNLFLAICYWFLFSCSSQKNINYTEQSVDWTLDKSLSSPESVYFDSASNLIFVSNVDGDVSTKDGKGYISIISADGKMIEEKWFDHLNAPKGMRAHDGLLWVSDIDQILAINIVTKKLIHKYSAKSAKFLNDIAIDKKGNVFVSDTLGSSIYRVKNGKISRFLHGPQLESPNGLLVDGGDLIVASWGLTVDWTTKINGGLYKINLSSKKITPITNRPLGNLDGLEIHSDGSYLSSDWKSGDIYKINKNGDAKSIHKGPVGLADIAYYPKTNTVIAPLMLNNKIIGINL